jgi:thiamine biosynthesis lipoprotein
MGNISWRALGATAVVRAPRTCLRVAQRAAAEAVAQVDRLASRFRAGSELCAVNAAAGEWTAISTGLADLVALSITAARASQGTVDPTLAVELGRLGYHRDWPELAAVDAGSPLSARPPPAPAPDRGEPWRAIELRRERGLPARLVAADGAITRVAGWPS